MRYVIPLLCAVLLGGCALGARNGAPANVYDFGQPAREHLAGGTLKEGGRLALEVRAAAWLDAPGLDYRLNYDDPLRRRQYSQSRWAAPPAALLAQRLRQQLGIGGGGVPQPSGCLMRIELHEFSQVFDTPADSRAVLRAQAGVIDGKRQALSGRAFAIDVAAATPDAVGGVQALVRSGEEFGKQLAGWLAALEKDGTLIACAPGR